MSRKKTREGERSYQFSDEALAVLDAARATWKLSEFVSQCVVEHGKILLGDKAPKSDPTEKDLLRYLETAVDEILYERLAKRFENPRIAKAHLRLIEDKEPDTWAVNKGLRRVALTKQYTKETSPAEWQALIRMKKRFLKEYEEE